MAFDGLHWTSREPAPGALLGELAAASAAAEFAWIATHLHCEDPYAPAPPASSHPLRVKTRERFRAAHAALVAARDLEEDDGAPFEELVGE